MVKRPSLRLQRTSNRLYTFCTCVSGPDPDRNVWGGGGGDTYIIDYTMELPFMNKYTFTAGGGGGGGENRT
jgi:hypothetical protein